MLFVGRPAFGQPDATVGLFKLVDGGDEAVRTDVKLGKASVRTIEVRGGLVEGDRVISERHDAMGRRGPRPVALMGEPMSEATTQPEVLIKLRDVSKVFYTDEVETHALAEVHLDVLRGEYVAMEGPSGSGKTTLLSILGLLDSPTSGSYQLGPDAGGAADRRRARDAAQSPHRLHLPVVQLDRRSDGLRERRAAAHLSRHVERASARNASKRRSSASAWRTARRHMPSQLSGGQQQRVAVARAVAGDPLILLADEPTGNLDSRNGDAVMELLQELHKQGATICMVTHNPEYAKQATRTINLFDGRVVDETRSAA